MSKIVEGMKFGFGIFISLLLSIGLLGIVYAVGFHSASEILPGTFPLGNFTFNGNISISNKASISADNESMYLYTTEERNISFRTNNSERMKITNSGAVKIVSSGGNIPHDCTWRSSSSTTLSTEVTVSCLANETIFAGGCTHGSALNLRLSKPEGNAWRCMWTTSSSDSKTAYGMCCKQ